MVVRVHIAFHLIHHSAHAVLAHLPHIVAVARMRSPIATDLTVVTSIAVFLTRLLRLLGAALWLHGNSLGLARSRRLPLILGE
jgi:hypothetical protein